MEGGSIERLEDLFDTTANADTNMTEVSKWTNMKFNFTDSLFRIQYIYIYIL